jgi:3-oxoacyl-[acyl-carrier-protein] synthase-3
VRRSVVAGVGSALPRREVTNAELAKTVDTSDEWIVERTGIRSRFIAGDGETTGSLALEAAKRALEHAGIAASEIDLIVLATATPDQTFPSTATKVQAALGLNDCIAFDVHAVCTGFLYALTVADSMVRSGSADKALVIGAETFSRILDWEDRATCVLFGDGAGALVVKLADVLNEVLEGADLSAADVDWVVPHQANARILDATAKKLGLPAEKVVVTVDKHANTSAASVPLAFDTAVKDGRIKRGDVVVLEAMGGGFTWGAAALRY